MKQGVTLIELLIAIGIMTLLAAVAVPIYGNFQNSSKVNEVSSVMTQAIRIAQQDAMAGVNNVNHGIKIFSDHYVLYQGNSYDTRNSALDRGFAAEGTIQITNSINNNEINFSLGSGTPNATGTISISGQNEDAQIISINKYGIAEISQ